LPVKRAGKLLTQPLGLLLDRLWRQLQRRPLDDLADQALLQLLPRRSLCSLSQLATNFLFQLVQGGERPYAGRKRVV
jgi:hypothetical protein